MGIQDGQVGCLYKAALWEAGGIHNLEHTSAHSVACMPLHSCPRSHGVHTGCTLTPAPQGRGHTQKEEALPEVCGAWRGTGGRQGTSFKFFRPSEARRVEEALGREAQGRTPPPDRAPRGVCS